MLSSDMAASASTTATAGDVYFVVGQPVTEEQPNKHYRIVCDEQRARALVNQEAGHEYRRCTSLQEAEQLQKNGFPPTVPNSNGKRSCPDVALTSTPDLTHKLRKRIDPFSRLDSLPDFIVELTKQLDFSTSCSSHDIQQVQRVRESRLVVVANPHGWCFIDLACAQFQFGRNVFCAIESSPEVVKRHRALVVSSIQQALVHMIDYLRVRDQGAEVWHMSSSHNTPKTINLWLPQVYMSSITVPEIACTKWFAACLSHRGSSQRFAESEHPVFPQQIALPFLIRHLAMHSSNALRFSFSFRRARDVSILRLGQHFLDWKLHTLQAEDAVFSNPLTVPQVQRLAWQQRDVARIPVRAQIVKAAQNKLNKLNNKTHSEFGDLRKVVIRILPRSTKMTSGHRATLPVAEVHASSLQGPVVQTFQVNICSFLSDNTTDQDSFAECRVTIASLKWCKWLRPRNLQQVELHLFRESALMNRLKSVEMDLGTPRASDVCKLTALEYLELRELLHDFGSRLTMPDSTHV